MGASNPNFVSYNLFGNINGSSFEGTKIEGNNEFKMKGRFYGEQAQEIGGVYSGRDGGYGIMGAFGATKNNP